MNIFTERPKNSLMDSCVNWEISVEYFLEKLDVFMEYIFVTRTIDFKEHTISIRKALVRLNG